MTIVNVNLYFGENIVFIVGEFKMAHIYLDQKGQAVYCNKGHEVHNGIFEFTLTRGSDVLTVETTKKLLKSICNNFDQYVTNAKVQQVSTS